MAETSVPSRGIQGRHVLFAMLGFFGVIFAVNGVFLYTALSTYTGVVAQEPYRKGLQYNRRIDEAARQDALGWREEVRLDAHSVAIQLVDPNGSPVTGLTVAGVVGRPSTNQHDVKVVLREASAGVYSAPLATLDAGGWIVDIEARSAQSDSRNVFYRTRKRLWLKP